MYLNLFNNLFYTTLTHIILDLAPLESPTLNFIDFYLAVIFIYKCVTPGIKGEGIGLSEGQPPTQWDRDIGAVRGFIKNQYYEKKLPCGVGCPYTLEELPR